MRKWVTRALALLLVIGIMTVMGVTLVKYGRNYAYGFFKSYTDYMPVDGDIFDNVSARIQKLDYNTENRLFGRDFFRHLCVAFQELLGKDVIAIGDSKMVKLTSGGYYDLFTDEYNDDKVKELLAFADELKTEYGIPTHLTYCHGTLYEDGLLPGNTALMDTNNAFADEVTEWFRQAGVTVTDSRDTYARAGLTMDTAVNKSDVHWTMRMALEVARDTAEDLREIGIGTEPQNLDIDRFIYDYYPSLLVGEYGRRVGENKVIRDDVLVWYPAYETQMLYEELTGDEQGVRREGSFKEAVVNEVNLECDEGRDYSTNAYYVYGHYLAITHTHNENAGDGRILIFKDSFGTPVTAFMGLTAKDVYAVDLRSTKKTMKQWVEELKPDVVVIAYSQQMLRDYEFVIEGN